jgi:hypothetical protein
MKHIAKHNFKNFLCMICASFMLMGCAYFEPKEKPPEETVDVTAVPVVEPVNMQEVIARKTKGRVQVFSLDDGPQAQGQSGDAVDVAPVQAVARPGTVQPDGGFAVPSDPNVRVFPLN